MNKLTSIRIKQNDGTYSDDIPIQVLAENVSWILGSSISLLDILGDVKYTTKGSIQHQLDTFSLDEVENARVGADDTQYQNLKARLDGEYEDLQDAIAAVTTNLQTETGARSNADAAIRTDLSSETTARINGDNLLSSQITTEVNARKAAINSEVTNRNNAISSAIATEVNNRNEAISSAIATEVNNRNEAISTEASTRATIDQNLQAQINQLVAPTGEAPSAAEVTNARIGANGTTYPSLGDAIRTQVSMLSGEIEDNTRGYTSLSSTDFIQAGQTAGQGIVTETRRLVSTKKVIPVKAGQHIEYTVGTNNMLAFSVFPDTTYTTATQVGSWLTGSGTAYINHDGYLLILVRNSSNTVITPGDFVSSVTVYNIYPYLELQTIEKKVNTPGYTLGTLVRGLYIVGDGTIGATTNGCLAVYPVENSATYRITKLITSDQFRFAFGDSATPTVGQSVDGFKIPSSTAADATNLWNRKYLYVYFAISSTMTADNGLSVVKYDASTAHYIENVAVDLDQIIGDSYLAFSSVITTTGFPVQNQTCFVETKRAQNNLIYQDIWYPTVKRRFFRQRRVNGEWLDWSEIQIAGREASGIYLSYVSPTVSKSAFDTNFKERTIPGDQAQDIAVYNGVLFDFAEGQCSVNGADAVSITNGHGNNANFGITLHGSYPYLYCGGWGEAKVYVNQYANGAFTLVRTISYTGITGYLNCAVDEANERVYMIVEQNAEIGDVEFIVGDFGGNVISQKEIDNIPYIEGMTYYDGKIIVTSGHSGVPSGIRVFDTDGNLVSKTAAVDVDIAVEGVDVDNATGKIYIADVYNVWC